MKNSLKMSEMCELHNQMLPYFVKSGEDKTLNYRGFFRDQIIICTVSIYQPHTFRVNLAIGEKMADHSSDYEILLKNITI